MTFPFGSVLPARLSIGARQCSPVYEERGPEAILSGLKTRGMPYVVLGSDAR